MKNTLKSVTVAFATDDLELVIKSLELLQSQTKSDNIKDETNRLIWKLSQGLNPDLYDYSESFLMNS